MREEVEEDQGEEREEEVGEGQERYKRQRFSSEIVSEQVITRTLKEYEGRNGSLKKWAAKLTAIFEVRADA